MDRDIFVSLLETIVLSNVVQIVTSDDDRTGHLVLDNDAAQDTTTDGNISGEWALLVDV